MNVPPKVRNFVWRACTDILPTRTNLYRRRVTIDPLLNLRTNRWNSWTCALRVSHGQKRVGDGSRKIAEMWSSGNGDLGYGGMDHLERQEQVLLWGKTIPTKGHPSGCDNSFTGLSEMGQTLGWTMISNQGRYCGDITRSALVVIVSFYMFCTPYAKGKGVVL